MTTTRQEINYKTEIQTSTRKVFTSDEEILKILKENNYVAKDDSLLRIAKLKSGIRIDVKNSGNPDSEKIYNTYRMSGLETLNTPSTRILNLKVSSLRLSVYLTNILKTAHVTNVAEFIDLINSRKILEIKTVNKKLVKESLNCLSRSLINVNLYFRYPELMTCQQKENLLLTSVKELRLSPKTLNVLKSIKISTIGSLVKFSKRDLIKKINLGEKTISEIEERLNYFCLKLRSES